MCHSVLHDVEEEQKKSIFYYHSEKLAIVFGLISIPHRLPIRIVKNLHVSGECHTATKFISKIVDREILLGMLAAFITSRMGWVLVKIIGDTEDNFFHGVQFTWKN